MDYKKLIIPLLALLAVVFLFFGFVTKAASPGETSISISPLTFDLAGNPGDSLVNELLVRNSGKDTVGVSIEAQDFVATGEEGDINLTDNKSSYSLASWVQSDTGTFNLNGGQQKRVKFSINIPYKAEPGGHYASVYAKISPTLSKTASGSYVGQKIGSLVLLRVAGAAKENAKIESFKTSKQTYSKGPVNFDIRIGNTGTVHLKPKGIIAVTDMWGKKIADVTVDQKNVLPGATRHLTAKWDKTPSFGKYTATLLSYYGTENKQLTAATTFWIIPWRTILIWVVVILAIIAAAYIGRKRLKEASKALLGKR